MPATGRQVTLAAWMTSDGQLVEVPVQVSATSHGPTAARHTVVVGAKVSFGQVVDEPVQFSATSHGPADGRHTTDGPASACTQPPPSPRFGFQVSTVHGR